MSSKTPRPKVTAARAAQLVELLGATDPAAAQEREGSAARHFERARARASRPQAPAKPGAGASPPAGATAPGGATTPGGATASGGATAPPGAAAARVYLHAGPTRSPVLNAFLNELGGDLEKLVDATVHVFDEHTLAPRLVELARQRVVSMLLAQSKTEAGLVLSQLPPIANERAARHFMRQAVHVGGGLGAITRDYGRHHRRTGSPDHDDLHASCIMATFAGRLNAMAEKLLGPHVRGELRAELERLTSQGRPPARRPRARELRGPEDAGSGRSAPDTRPLDAASATRRPRGR
ncbi:hypothetical protein SOCE26_039440 [Sorangium cellulosum]|uniref:Uncharacterized protein n=1 Tax=Sorangium cellulosum TaxID=56 RepID=A0A2L0ET91_SORCE|nr:hypothetical protein [Sorangium cellulosum]AUX42511.1 hypothetical protein SOCE26_039440 [Sorangium cellulosum]